jgi:Cdc6-like AAA superfamily ATPase
MTIDSHNSQDKPRDPKSWRAMTNEERYRIVEGLFVLYPRLNCLWTALDQHIQSFDEAKRAEAPSCLVLTGVTGMGKTHLVERWLVQKALDNNQENCLFSYVFFTFTERVSSRSFFLTALHAASDVSSFTGRTYRTPFRLISHLENLKPNVLIIDNVNRLVSLQKGDVRRDEVCDLEALVKWVKIPIILIGKEEEMKKIIETSPALARRIDLQHLTPFIWDKAEPQTIQEFRSLLEALDQALPFDRSEFSEEVLAFSFFTATRGILGSLLELLRTAAAQAIEASEEVISVQRLAQAYATRLASSSIGRHQKNPFDPLHG